MRNLFKTRFKKRGGSSIDAKLKLFMSCIMIPLVLMVIFLISTLTNYNQQYNEIVRNVSIASEFNFDFKETLDYKMYRYIIGGGKNFNDYRTADDINAAKSVIDKLKTATTRQDNFKRLETIETVLKNLEGYIYSIRDVFNDSTGPRYTNSMRMLNDNVHQGTETIQNKIHEYIYYELVNLEELRERTSRQINTTIRWTAVVSALMFLALWIVGTKISKGISEPIKELLESTKAVAKGDFTPRPLEEIHTDEIQSLSDSFSKMVERIAQLVDDVKLEQVNLRKTELKLLQSQINPHFLYNTLDTIIWLAEDNQNEQVVDMVTALSAFFRTTLSKGKDFVTIKEEETHIQSYLQIQQKRYRDIMDYSIDIADEIGEYTILKLTLQPLVENALYHGIKNKRGRGHIQVTGRNEYGNLVFKVLDNGIGMKEEDLQHLRKVIEDRTDHKEGFGLANVNERIKLNYGREYGLGIDSKYGVGTEITVIIPAQIELIS